jgi:hypothetical protein
MIRIRVNRHYDVLVDDDCEYLKYYSWMVYRIRGIFYAKRRNQDKWFNWNMSWDVVGKPEPGFVVDHINGQGLDNRRENLRIITYRQNSQNRHSESTSKFPGVYRRNNRWAATMTIEGKVTYLGTYTTEEEAFAAYKLANEILGFPEVIMPFTEEALIDYNKVSRNEYFRMLQLMKQDGLSDQEIEENLKGVEIIEDRNERENTNLQRNLRGNGEALQEARY